MYLKGVRQVSILKPPLAVQLLIWDLGMSSSTPLTTKFVNVVTSMCLDTSSILKGAVFLAGYF